ncbi:MAG: hypothetical protein DI547_03790 [Sphingobium sp.]|nr:MAG: hypothetical protein DI547_03790 [Sphingobium sp.]
MLMNWHIVLALLLSALLPVSLLVAEYELRHVRMRTVEDLRDTIFAQDRELPQLLLALARYDRLRATNRPGRQDETRRGAGAVLFTLICFGGFLLLFDPIACLLGETCRLLRLSSAIFWVPIEVARGATESTIRQSVAIAATAFMGGYVFSISYLIRAMLNQELSALSFTRSGMRIILGVIVAIVVHHVGAGALGDGSIQFTVSLATAFIIGYFPDRSFSLIARLTQIQIKSIDRDAMRNAPLIPLEVIDGIDHEISFRLQENNLADVQNLATANPIELYVQTPYTMLQTFDWVLQAQLCEVVGATAFHELRRHKIRTIFDLERAVLPEGVPEEYIQAIGSVVLTDASPAFRQRIGLPADASIKTTCDPLVIRHIVATLSDDLHIHRLRALWKSVMSTTGGQQDNSNKPLWLFKTPPLPGEDEETPTETPNTQKSAGQDTPPPPLSPPSPPLDPDPSGA